MISKSIKEYIDNNISECNNDLELAYTIYYLLGKVLYYSPLYARYKLDNLVPEVDRITLDNPYVNCNTWSELYNEILNLYGIESKVIGDKHKKVEFIADKYKLRADATIYLPDDVFDIASDLTNIKFGLDIIHFQLINNQYRKDFNKSIDQVNRRFNINKGRDYEVLKDIKNNIDRNKNNILYGINFYNDYYKLCDGEVERRQLFERYYPLLFGYTNNDLISFYDTGILSKHLLKFRDIYYLETSDGFIEKNLDEIRELINDKKIDIKYQNDMDKLCNKTLKKVM